MNLNLEELKKFIISRLPFEMNDHEIIAGGYILGEVFEFLKISKNKSKDIDVFISASEDSRGESFFKDWLDKNNIKDAYPILFKEKNKLSEIIHIVKSKRLKYLFKEINYIYYVSNCNFTNFINSFDLNCVQCGLLKNNQDYTLYLSNNFIKFLDNFELKVVTLGDSYLRNLARMLTKKEQYDFIKFDQKEHLKTSFFYFNENEYKNFLTESNYKTLLKSIHSRFIIFKEDKIFLNYKFKENELLVRKKFFKFFYKNNRPFLTKKEINKCLYISEYDSITEEIVIKYDLINQDFKKTDINFVNKFLKKHPIFKEQILHLNIKDISALKIFLKNIDKEAYDIGFLESLQSEFLGKISNKKDINILKRKLLKNNNQYKPLIYLDYFHKYFKELTTQDELIQESRIMGHCVKGYFPQVMNCSYRIFHVKTDKNDSTLCIYYKNGSLQQHLSFRNRKPHKKNVLLVKLFIQFYKKYYQSKNSDWVDDDILF